MKLSVKNVIIYLVFFAVFLVPFKQIFAETVATSVIVGNSAPTFTVQPFETIASTTISPTNVGSTVTFQATGTDGNSENYYLAVCKTNAITAHNSAAPTCDGGNWCISGSTTSGASTTCGYGTLQADAQSNNWFAFVCDYSPSSSCSSVSQGTSDSGSPFAVNHAPSFPTISNVANLNPGSTETWNTSIGASDADVGDTVKLLACKTAGVTGGACTGATWCASSGVTNTPSCSIGISIPTADQSYPAYVYVFDSHNFAATGANQGIGSSYVVNNVAPVVSAITLNSGSDISLSEGTTYPVVLGATITDNNGCSDISSVVSSLYRSSVGYSGCDTGGEANSNNCYPVINCSVGGGNTCDGATDASASYTCTAEPKYYADSTVANTNYSGDNWLNTFKASDGTLSDAETIGSGVEMNDLLAMDIGASLAFGNLSAGQTLSPLTATTIVTSTGNVGLDQTLQGTDMLSVGNSIAVNNQRYALAASTAYSAGTNLTTSAVSSTLSCKKTTSDVGETKPTYWGISIPIGTVAGNYSGTNTIIAVKSAYARW
jgi:hypothetical protein